MEEIVTTISEDLGFKLLGAKVILPPFPNERLPLASLDDFKINNEANLFVATCSNQIIFGNLQKLRDFVLSEKDAENDLQSYNFTILNDIISDDDDIIFVDISYSTKQIVVITLCGKLFLIDFENFTTLKPFKQIDSNIKILKCLIINDTLYYIDSNHSLKCFRIFSHDEFQVLIPDNVADFDKLFGENKLVILTRNDNKLQFYNILKGSLTLENTLDHPEDITSALQESDDSNECLPLNVATLYHNQYLLVFGNSPNSDNEEEEDENIVYDHKTYILKLDSNNEPTYYETFDLAPAFGVIKRFPLIYNIVLPDLVDGVSNFNIVTSSCSTELSIWDSKEIVQPDQDSERAVLPISKETDNDTCPIGMALDYSTHGNIAEPCSGVDSVERLPLIYVLNNEGRLHIWGFYHSHAIKQKTFHVEKLASFYMNQNNVDLAATATTITTTEDQKVENDVDTIVSNNSDKSSIFTNKDDQETIPTKNEDVSESKAKTEFDTKTSTQDDITNSLESFSFGQTNNSTNGQKQMFGFGSYTFGNATGSPFTIPENTGSTKLLFGQKNNSNVNNEKTSAFGTPLFNQSIGNNSNSNSVFGTPAFGKFSFGQLQLNNIDSSTTESVFGKPAFGKPSFGQSQTENNNISTTESVFGKPSFGQSQSNNNNSSTTESVFGKPAFGKPSFGQSQTENNNISTTESVFGKPSFGQSQSNNNNSSITESVFGKPAFGKPSFGQSQTENNNTSTTESVFGKPAFGKSSFGQSQSNSINSTATESVFGKPSFGQFQSENGNSLNTETSFGKSGFAGLSKIESPFASIAKNESPFEKLFDSESPFANITKKESPFANVTSGESPFKKLEQSQNYSSEENKDFRETDTTEKCEELSIDENEVEDDGSNGVIIEDSDNLTDSTVEQTPSVPLKKNESKFSLSSFAINLKKTANISTSDLTDTKFEQFNNDLTEKSSSPFASFANNLNKSETPSFSFSKFHINNEEEDKQLEEPNELSIKNDNEKKIDDLENSSNDNIEEKSVNDESKTNDISKLESNLQQDDDKLKDKIETNELFKVKNEANKLSNDLVNQNILQDDQQVNENKKKYVDTKKDFGVSKTIGKSSANDEKEGTNIVLETNENVDDKKQEIGDETNLSISETSEEKTKNQEESENVVVGDERKENDEQTIDHRETSESEVHREESGDIVKPQVVSKTVESIDEEVQAEPIEYKDMGIQIKEFNSQSCQTDEIKYEIFQMNSFEEDENYLAELYMPLPLGKYYTNANISNIPYASTDKTMRLLESTYQQVNAEFKVLEDNLESMKNFFEDQTTIKLGKRTEQSIGNKYTWRIPEVRQLFSIIQKRQLKLDDISRCIDELAMKVSMFIKKDSDALLQQRDEIKERYVQTDYLRTEVLNNQYAPLSYHQNLLKRVLREKMSKLEEQSEEISQCLYISKSFVNYLKDPLNTDIRLLLMSAEYFDAFNKSKSKPLNIDISGQISQDQIQSLDVVQVGLNLNAKKQMGEFFKGLRSKKC